MLWEPCMAGGVGGGTLERPERSGSRHHQATALDPLCCLTRPKACSHLASQPLPRLLQIRAFQSATSTSRAPRPRRRALTPTNTHCAGVRTSLERMYGLLWPGAHYCPGGRPDLPRGCPLLCDSLDFPVFPNDLNGAWWRPYTTQPRRTLHSSAYPICCRMASPSYGQARGEG